MPSRVLARQVARSLDAPTALVPVLPELFAGVVSLGGSPGSVVRLLREAGLHRRHNVIDLACGKGAVAVPLAKRIGCRVLGIDGCEPFLAAAAERSHRHGVSHLVRWVAADVRKIPRSLTRGGFDAALMLGLYPFADATQLLRNVTRSGGVYVIDDCVRNPRRGRVARALAKTPTLDECNAHIASLGDAVEAVEIPPPSKVRLLNDRLYARLELNAARVLRKRPRLRRAIREFLRWQRDANALLNGPICPCIWVVRRQ